ncbi:MAG: hypothetical protein JSV17_03250 [Candidatus Aminicenantes bacterium]|nr:MAG: hypothetical protein JSV17_03250 [Candidatus Aminicenantes bacterium]
MKDILGMISLTTAASVLLILAATWLVILIIKRQHEYVFRAMLIMLILLLGLIFLRQHEAGKLTWPDIQLKIFPEKSVEYIYTEKKTYTRGQQVTRYVFHEPQPRLSLRLDPSGAYFHITDLKPVNDMLKHLNLPEVKETVSELASITGSKRDANLYKWENYAGGTLILERTLCQDPESLEIYQGVSNIRILR